METKGLIRFNNIMSKKLRLGHSGTVLSFFPALGAFFSLDLLSFSYFASSFSALDDFFFFGFALCSLDLVPSSIKKNPFF
jgi:hypothetical protein